MEEAQLIGRIKRIMDGMGINVSEFSRLTGISQSNMSSMLNGKRKIGDAIINKIVLSFDINKDWLLSGEGEMKKESTSIVSEPMVSYGEKESGSISAISIIDRNSRSIEKMVEIADRNSRSIQQLVDSNMKLIELLHQNGIIVSDETRKGGFYDSNEDKEDQSRNTRTTQAG